MVPLATATRSHFIAGQALKGFRRAGALGDRVGSAACNKRHEKRTAVFTGLGCLLAAADVVIAVPGEVLAVCRLHSMMDKHTPWVTSEVKPVAVEPGVCFEFCWDVYEAILSNWHVPISNTRVR
jgi:hypothetical protein